mmetsp:Transcript_54351/g.100365  ORF Transcript_54351/g.100365 Transcript_54351/m.100365 type:complete len:87 (+) Transcript_54351:769-1029(+)
MTVSGRIIVDIGAATGHGALIIPMWLRDGGLEVKSITAGASLETSTVDRGDDARESWVTSLVMCLGTKADLGLRMLLAVDKRLSAV